MMLWWPLCRAVSFWAATFSNDAWSEQSLRCVLRVQTPQQLSEFVCGAECTTCRRRVERDVAGLAP